LRVRKKDLYIYNVLFIGIEIFLLKYQHKVLCGCVGVSRPVSYAASTVGTLCWLHATIAVLAGHNSVA